MIEFNSSFNFFSLDPIIKCYHNLDEVGLRGEYPWVDQGHDSQAGQQPVCLSINVCDCDPSTFYYNAIDEGDTWKIRMSWMTPLGNQKHCNKQIWFKRKADNLCPKQVQEHSIFSKVQT